MISHRSGPKNAGALKKQINLSRKYWDVAKEHIQSGSEYYGTQIRIWAALS